jgi:hypothetical protein
MRMFLLSLLCTRGLEGGGPGVFWHRTIFRPVQPVAIGCIVCLLICLSWARCQAAGVTENQMLRHTTFLQEHIWKVVDNRPLQVCLSVCPSSYQHWEAGDLSIGPAMRPSVHQSV